jgi:aryl-alcohol dehydrogenase-like predicted oxidoreductase
LRVSTLALGTANFGTQWGHGANRAEARAMFDAYREAGGNFIDTADAYQFGEAERFLGEFIGGNERNDIVLGTKYSYGPNEKAGPLRVGNSRKNMRISVEASLKRLNTDRIDLFWVHMPDGITPVEEILRGLDDLVRAGKIVYGGLSDFPAWRVSAGATMAQLRGWTPVSALQIEYSLVERTGERELLPMADAFAMGVVGWSPLGGGFLTGKYRAGEKGRAGNPVLGEVVHAENTEQKAAILDTLLRIAQDCGRSASQIAIAWTIAKGIVPIIGPRTMAQLKDNLAACDVELSAGQMKSLDEVSAVAPGFPHEMLARAHNRLSGGNIETIDPSTPGII